MTLEESIRYMEEERAKQEQARIQSGIDSVLESDPPIAARVQNVAEKTGVRVHKDDLPVVENELKRSAERKRVISGIPMPSFMGPMSTGIGLSSAVGNWLKEPENAEVTSVEDLDKMHKIEERAGAMSLPERLWAAGDYWRNEARSNAFGGMEGGDTPWQSLKSDATSFTRGAWLKGSLATLAFAKNIRSLGEHLIEWQYGPDEYNTSRMESILSTGQSWEQAIETRANELIRDEGAANLSDVADYKEQAMREFTQLRSPEVRQHLRWQDRDAQTPLGEAARMLDSDQRNLEKMYYSIEYMNNGFSNVAGMLASTANVDRATAMRIVLGGEEGQEDYAEISKQGEAALKTGLGSTYNPFLPISENILNPAVWIGGSMEQGVNTVGGLAIGTGAAVATGSPLIGMAAGAAFFIPTAVGEEAESFRGYRDANGEPLPRQYRVFATNVTGTAVGLFEGAVNQAGVHVLGLDKMARRMIVTELKTALGSASKTGMRKTMEFGARTIAEAGLEGFEEFEQTWVSAFGEEVAIRVANARQGMEFDERRTAADWAPVLEESLIAAREGFTASILFGAGGSTMTFIDEQRHVKRAEQVYRSLISLVAEIKELDMSKPPLVRTISSDRLDSFLRAALPDGGKDVFFNVDEWAEIWRDVDGADPRATWKSMFGDTRAYDEAYASKGERSARVETAKALRAISQTGTKMLEIISLIKKDLAGMSPKRAMEYASKLRTQYAAELKDLTERSKAGDQIEDGLSPEEAAYFQNVRDRMIAGMKGLEANEGNPERAVQQASDEAIIFLAHSKVNAERLGVSLLEVMGMTLKEIGGRPATLTAEILSPEENDGLTKRETGLVPAEWVSDLVGSPESAPKGAKRTRTLRGEKAVLRVATDGTVTVVSGQDYLNHVAEQGAHVRVEIQYEGGADFDHTFQATRREVTIPSNVKTLQQGDLTDEHGVTKVSALHEEMEATGALAGMSSLNFDNQDPSDMPGVDVLFASTSLSAASSWVDFSGRLTAIAEAMNDQGIAYLHLPTSGRVRRDGARTGVQVNEEQMVAILGMFFTNVIVEQQTEHGAIYRVAGPTRIEISSVSPWQNYYNEEVTRIEDEVGAVIGLDVSSRDAVQAALLFLGGEDFGWSVYNVRQDGGGVRWFLRHDEDGSIIDPYRAHGPIDYESGVKSGVPTDLSAGAKRAVSRVMMLREEPARAADFIRGTINEASVEYNKTSSTAARVARFRNRESLTGPDTPLLEPGWSIITSDLAALDEDARVALRAELKKDLLRPGWTIMPTVGAYEGDAEKGFIVIGMTREQALAMGRKWGQEAVLTSDGLVYSDGTIQRQHGIDFLADGTEDGYTGIEMDDGTTVKFAFQFDFAEPRETIMLSLTHRSKVPGLTELDPAFQESGLGGREFAGRKKNVGDLFIPRMNFDETGARQEPRVAALPNEYTAQIPEGRVYDATADRDGLLKDIRAQYPDEGKEEHFSRLEIAIRDSDKYDAIRVSGGSRPSQVIVFNKIAVEEVVEIEVGGMGKARVGRAVADIVASKFDFLGFSHLKVHAVRIAEGMIAKDKAAVASAVLGLRDDAATFMDRDEVEDIIKMVIETDDFIMDAVADKTGEVSEVMDATRLDDIADVQSELKPDDPHAREIRTKRLLNLASMNFWRWFKNSQATHPVTGAPILLFHGTMSAYDLPGVMNPTYGELGFHVSTDFMVGAHFAANHEEPLHYDKLPHTEQRVHDDFYMGARDSRDWGGAVPVQSTRPGADPRGHNDLNMRVYGGYASIQNPLTLVDMGTWDAMSVFPQLEAQGLITREMSEEYEALGPSEIESRLAEFGVHSNGDPSFLFVHGAVALAILNLGFDSVKYINRREVITGFDGATSTRTLGTRTRVGIRENTDPDRVREILKGIEDNPDLWLSAENFTYLNRVLSRFHVPKRIASAHEAYLEDGSTYDLYKLVEEALDAEPDTFFYSGMLDVMTDEQFRVLFPESADTYILLLPTQFKSLDNPGAFGQDELGMLAQDVELANHQDKQALAQVKRNAKRFDSGVEGLLLGEDGKQVPIRVAIEGQIANVTKLAKGFGTEQERSTALSKIPSVDDVMTALKKHIRERHSSDGWRKDYLVAPTPFYMTPEWETEKATDRGWKLNFKKGTYGLDKTSDDGKPLPYKSKKWAAHAEKVALRAFDEIKAVFDLATQAERTPEADRTSDQLNAIEQVRQMQWYLGSRENIRSVFGGLGDLFVDLMAAASPQNKVQPNFDQAVTALRIAVDGGYDDIIADVHRWATLHDSRKRKLLEYFNHHRGQGRAKGSIKRDAEYIRLLGEYKVVKTYSAASKDKDSLLKESGEAPFKKPTSNDEGTLFGVNSTGVALALADLFRITIAANPDTGTTASSPKTKRFGANLSGLSEAATVDMWVARFIRRMMNDVYRGKFPRISPQAEPGVAGKVVGGQTYFGQTGVPATDETNREFGMGQDVYDRVAAMLQDTGDSRFAGLTPQMIQALTWFREKQVWGENGWSDAVDGSVTEQFERESLRRYFANIEGGGDLTPTDLGRLHSAALASDPRPFGPKNARRVVTAKIRPSTSAYSSDGAIDVEVASRKDWDGGLLMLEMVKVARERSLPATYFSRIVEEDTPNSRPMVEVWFNEVQDARRAVSIAARAARGSGLRVELVTDIHNDGRKVPGIRVSWLPELSERQSVSVGSSPANAARMMKKMRGIMGDVVVSISQEFDEGAVQSIRPSSVETRVVHALEYDDAIQRGSVEETGGSIWDGTGIYESSRRFTELREEQRLLGAEALFGDDRGGSEWMTSQSLSSVSKAGGSTGAERDAENGFAVNQDVEPIDTESADRIAEPVFRKIGKALTVHLSPTFNEDPARKQDLRILGVKLRDMNSVAALLGVYSQDTVEVQRVFAIKKKGTGLAISNETAVTNRMPGYVAGDPGKYLGQVEKFHQWVEDQGLEDDETWVLMHNHPGGWASPSRGDVGNTYGHAVTWTARRISSWVTRNLDDDSIMKIKLSSSPSQLMGLTTKGGHKLGGSAANTLWYWTGAGKSLISSPNGGFRVDSGRIYDKRFLAGISAMARTSLRVFTLEMAAEPTDAGYGLPTLSGHIVIDHRSIGAVTISPSMGVDRMTPTDTYDNVKKGERDPAVKRILSNTDHIDMKMKPFTKAALQTHTRANRFGLESAKFPLALRDPNLQAHLDDPASDKGTVGVQTMGFQEPDPAEQYKTLPSQDIGNDPSFRKAVQEAMAYRNRQLSKDHWPVVGVAASGMVLFLASIDSKAYDLQTPDGEQALIKELVELRQKTGAISIYAGVDYSRIAEFPLEVLDSGALAAVISLESEVIGRLPTITGYDRSDSSRAKGTYGQGRTDIWFHGQHPMARGERLYQAASGDVKRGYYDPVAKKIKLLTAADPSTMIHELGHSFLSMLMQVSSRPDVNAIAEDDRTMLMDFLGINDWNDIGVAEQEKFALAFERYVAEGNSPSIEMREAFARAHAWMLSVYGEVEKVGVEINDEIREFFARLLATKEQVEEARRSYRLEIAQELASLASNAEWIEYEALARKAAERGATDIRLEAMREARRETESWFRDVKDRVRAEVQDAMTKEPLWAALAFLQSGELPTNVDLPESWKNGDGKPLKLSRNALVENYGKDRVTALPRPFVYTRSSESLDPEDVALFFGFANDDAMIAAFETVGATSYRREVTRRTDEILATRFGDMMRNRQEMVEKAADSVHNNEAFDMLLMEAELIAKKLGKKGGLNPRRAALALQAAAGEEVGKMRVGDLKPHVYLSMEQKLARDFRSALNRGALSEAHTLQEKRIWAHAMYRATKDAKIRAEKTRDKIRKNTTSKALLRIGKAGEYYTTAVIALSEMFTTKTLSAKALVRIEGLRAAILRMKDDGRDVVFGDDLIESAKKKTYREATVAEYDALRRALDNILHLARVKSRLKSKRRTMEMEDISGLMTASAEANVPEGGLYDPDRHGKSTRERIAERAKGYDSNLVRLEPIIDLLDGGDINGPWREFFWNRFVEAQHAQAVLLDEYAEVIETVYKMLDKKARHALYSKTVKIESAGGKEFTRQALIVAALNMGTDSNYERLLNKQRNVRWGEDVVQEMISHLTNDEWNFVEGIWVSLQSLWPLISDLEAKLTGVRPKPLDTRSFTVTVDGKERVMGGGYYPLVYGGQSRASRLQDTERPLSSNEYIRAMTPHGWVNKRVEKVGAPILLDLDVFPGHLLSVIHDLTHREAVIDGQRILADPEVRFVIEDRLGEKYMKVFDEMVRRVARENNQRLDYMGFMEKIRANATVMTMGMKATVAMQNFTNFANVLEPGVGVRPDYLMKGIAQWTKNPMAAHSFIRENSPELSHRFTTFDRDVRTVSQSMTGRRTVKAYITRAAFAGIAITDLLVAETSWMGKYQHAMDRGVTHDQAVMEADRMVTLTLGAGGAKDLSLIQGDKNEMSKWFTMYYSWFANAYSRFWALKNGADRAYDEDGFFGLLRYAPYAFLKSISFWIIPAMVAEILSNRGPGDGEDDDEPSRIRWAGTKILFYPLYTVPGLREIAGGMENWMLGETVRPRAGLFADLMGKTSNFMNGMESATSNADGLDVLEELIDNGSFTSGVVDLVFGIGMGLPTKQAKITLGYWKDVYDGEVEPESLFELWKDSTYYREKD